MARLEVRLGELTAAMLWMMNNQLSRRNLLPYVRSDLALKLKPAIAEMARENQRGDQGGFCFRRNLLKQLKHEKKLQKPECSISFMAFLAFTRSMAAHHSRELIRLIPFKGIQERTKSPHRNMKKIH